VAIIDATYFNDNMTQLGLKSAFSPRAENLDTLIAEASEWVQNYLQRRVESTDLVEQIRGKDRNRLVVDHWPILELTTVEWADDSGSTGSIDVSDVRALSNGILEFKNPYSKGPWRACRTYTITYTAGMDPIPAVIKRATALKVVDIFSPMYQGARDVRSVEFGTNIEAMIVDLLEPYRRERIG
jgi:hypothetical protein